ncbi:MAG: BON domain-containing protein [Gammaproteobacteria bacterium]|jgi:osmotically-inducible protein OsmY|nr:BON domain-containing protein [Gammaproteobacteria bacterium]MBT5203309.1 BON domain-containing protein [Gammaproteobacteria bacterium]MBT5600646.1 BON domain-containing protein [Gammaproteobacteria bacterium]MBT6244561.1 BON domain-containing protein [Gammaproteobacteria bacterium]
MRTIFLLFTLIACSACSTVGPAQDDTGKRTFGTKLDDGRTAGLIKKNLNAVDEAYGKAHIEINVFNGVALLTGQVDNQELLDQASKIAGQIRHVSKVHNELQVAGPTSLLVRTSDSMLKTKIKTKMTFDAEVDANRIKVVVENGVVYLMGLLTRDEAKLAIELTRDSFGVQKIVQAFEYLN